MLRTLSTALALAVTSFCADVGMAELRSIPGGRDSVSFGSAEPVFGRDKDASQNQYVSEPLQIELKALHKSYIEVDQDVIVLAQATQAKKTPRFAPGSTGQLEDLPIEVLSQIFLRIEGQYSLDTITLRGRQTVRMGRRPFDQIDPCGSYALFRSQPM